MLGGILEKMLNVFKESPKTYIPLVAIVVLWGLGLLGVEVDEQLKQSVTVILMAIATALIRRKMVKKTDTDKMRVGIKDDVTQIRTDIRDDATRMRAGIKDDVAQEMEKTCEDSVSKK